MNLYLLKTSEIILKGKNRNYFEKILKENIFKALLDNLSKIENWGGEFFIELKDIKQENNLSNILGISSVVKIHLVTKNLNLLIEKLKELINIHYNKSFNIKLKVKRKDKDFKLNSKEIYDYIIKGLKYFTNHKKTETKKFYVIYFRKEFYLGEEIFRGLGGLPVGSSGKGIVLLSAGFDSPVASFLMMKRGLKVSFLHFHSYPQTTKESLEKVYKIVKILNQFNLGSVLYLMNILELQKFYFQNIPHKYLVIFYRRSMFRLATRLAEELGIKILITGENLGQVASQTAENLLIIQKATDLLILRPLIGLNKSEIINLAEKIGTKLISEIPGEDCCSLFIPKNPVTKAKLEDVEKLENKIIEDIRELEEKIYMTKNFEVFE